MISLPSFFKNKISPTEQPKVEPTFRSRQSKVSLEKEDVLTENPEVQRARHRLIGAGFLLLIAVIGLPRLFDAEPKKINNDVVVKVVQSVTLSPNTSNIPSETDKVISSTSPEVNSTKIPVTDLPSSAALLPDKPKSLMDSSVSNNSTSKKGILQTDPGEVIINSPSLNAAKSPAKEVGKDPTSIKPELKTAKYIVQVAALSSNDRVKNLTTKIKDLNITTYVLEKKRDAPDTSVIYLVRAGPFNSKEEAVNAEKKISTLGMGLSPTIVEINK